MDEEEDEEGKKKRSEVFELRDKMIFNEDLKFYTDQKIIMARVNNNTLFLLCYSQNKMHQVFIIYLTKILSVSIYVWLLVLRIEFKINGMNLALHVV